MSVIQTSPSSFPTIKSKSNPLLLISSTGSQDIFDAMQLFMASSAADAALSAQEILIRAQSSRSVNESKRAYQAKGVQNKDGDFVYSKDEAGEKGLFQIWLNRFALPGSVPGGYIPNPAAFPAFSQDEVNKMVNLRSAMSSDGKLTASQKQELDNIMASVWTMDANGQAVISDEQMTIMLQQYNGLYQNWINGNQKLTASETDLLKELIRGL